MRVVYDLTPCLISLLQTPLLTVATGHCHSAIVTQSWPPSLRAVASRYHRHSGLLLALITTVTQGCYSLSSPPSLRLVTRRLFKPCAVSFCVCASMLCFESSYLTLDQVAPGLGGSWPPGRPVVREGATGAHVQSLTSLTHTPIPALQPPSAPPSAGGHPAQLPRREAEGSLWQGPCPQPGRHVDTLPGRLRANRAGRVKAAGCPLLPGARGGPHPPSPAHPPPWGTRGPHSPGWKQGFELERVCLSALVVLWGAGRRGRHQGGHSLKGHRPPSQGSRIPA